MDRIQKLFNEAKEKATAVKALLDGDDPDMEQVATLQAEADGLIEKAKAYKAAYGTIDIANKPQMDAPLPDGDGDGTAPKSPDQEKEENPAVKAMYHLRYGDEAEAVKAILHDLHGTDYNHLRWKKDASFNRWLREFTSQAVPAEGKMFLWTPDTIKLALSQGQDVRAMKATMVEAIDTLGGYLVPEDYRAEIIQRLMGMTIMRGRATSITTSRDSVEIPTATGGDSQYTGAVRVTWVDETPASAATSATNATFGMERIPIHTVMASTDLSQNLIEDSAFNLAAHLSRQFAEAAAIDEDNQFLTGDGNSKPQGLLPSSSNDLSLGEANSGSASSLTWDGLIALMYAIDAQYRQNASWVMEKATAEIIAKLKDSNGQYLWRERFGNNVSEGRPIPNLMGYPVLEQEAMPTVASNAYPILFGDPRGYYIVDRVGMSILRFVDGDLAVKNQVRYVMRRRLGGQLVETYRYKVQKVSA